MGADRVEVAQGYALDAVVSLDGVAQDVLAHLFGVAVRRLGFLARAPLGHRQNLRLAVNRAG